MSSPPQTPMRPDHGPAGARGRAATISDGWPVTVRMSLRVLADERAYYEERVHAAASPPRGTGRTDARPGSRS
ncbi:MAG: hypothetical protein V9G10_13725 [Candidatus Nanopelagicales bacterium]